MRGSDWGGVSGYQGIRVRVAWERREEARVPSHDEVAYHRDLYIIGTSTVPLQCLSTMVSRKGALAP